MQAKAAEIIESSQDQLKRTIDEVWATLPPVWNRIRENIRSIAEQQYGVSVEQFHILRHIRKGLTSVSELAQVKQISRSAISQAVDVLVERGLISRRQNEQDRRNIPLELTEAGNRLLDAIWEKNKAWMGGKMVGLSPEELEIIASAMGLLEKAFSERP